MLKKILIGVCCLSGLGMAAYATGILDTKETKDVPADTKPPVNPEDCIDGVCPVPAE